MAAFSSSSVTPGILGSRRRDWLAALVILFGLAVTVGGSLVTGPCFDEERRIAAARHATVLARALTDFGPGALVSSSAQGIYDELSSFGVLAGLLSGWLGEVLSRAHLVDGVTGARIGWLLVTGLSPGAVYLIVEGSRGRRVAALAAALLVAMPRWMHAASAAREPAIVGSFWLLALAAYLRSSLAERSPTRRRRSRAAGVVFALVIGFGVATDPATLWVLPLLVAHYSWASGSASWKALRRGWAPLPAALLWAVVLSPLVVLVAAPQLWRGGATSAAEWFLGSLSPTIEPNVYQGPVVSIRDVPPGYAAHFLWATIPVATLLLAAAGGVVMAMDALAVRRGIRARDKCALGVLCLLTILATVIGPMVTPRPLILFPPRVETALPFVAIAAAVALERLAIRVVSERRATWAVLGSGMIATAIGLSGLPTASAEFNAFSGGTRGAMASRTWTIGDGSEVAVLARAIDALGAPRVNIQSTEVPRSYWTLLSQTGWLRTRVGGARGIGELAVSRDEQRRPLATVTRNGATLWSLTRR